MNDFAYELGKLASEPEEREREIRLQQGPPMGARRWWGTGGGADGVEG